MTDHDDLKRLAGEATPGPWRAWESSDDYQSLVDAGAGTLVLAKICSYDAPVDPGPDRATRKANAAYIAAANPARVLALIAEVEGLRVKLEECSR
jgi:hypothetical protein